MKKLLLLLITFLGIGFAAKAQSCEVGDGTYVAVNATVSRGYIKCTANYYGDNVPTSGTVYVTVYYIDKDGNEDYEVITLSWNIVNNSTLQHGLDAYWEGKQDNVARIKRWEVSAGACQFR